MSENQITINNLSKIYENGFSALKNINLKIKKGEIFAMLGPNGAGKTTLINIICGIVTPTSGNITIDGFECAGHPGEDVMGRWASQKFIIKRSISDLLAGKMIFLSSLNIRGLLSGP